MNDVTKGEGRTVLFVSHNITAIKSLCSSGLVMMNGALEFDGSIEKAISVYNGDKQDFGNKVILGENKDFKNDLFDLNEISLIDENFLDHELDFLENEKFSLLTDLRIKDKNNSYHLSYIVKNFNNEVLFTMSNAFNTKLEFGENKLICDIPANFFNVGEYILSLYIIKNVQESVLYEEDILTFRIKEKGKELGDWMGIEPGFIKTDFQWKQL